MGNNQLLAHVLMPCIRAARSVAEMVGKGSYLLQVRNILVGILLHHDHRGWEVATETLTFFKNPFILSACLLMFDQVWKWWRQKIQPDSRDWEVALEESRLRDLQQSDLQASALPTVLVNIRHHVCLIPCQSIITSDCHLLRRVLQPSQSLPASSSTQSDSLCLV